jgi:hypothetical protein
LQKSDFRGINPKNAQKTFRDDVLNKASTSAKSGFNKPLNPLAKFPLKGKIIFNFHKLEDELVARKLCENIKHSQKITSSGRSQIVSNLRLLLEEGIPYRIYRLDIKSFYESFKQTDVLSTINELPRLSPQSKALLTELFSHHAILGGLGIPRGLSLSAALSNLLMQEFDLKMRASNDVFFYSRYVDDIIAVTSAREDSSVFLKKSERLLLPGMQLNQAKKQIVSATNRVSPTKPSEPTKRLFDFDYLGYAFLVDEPIKDPQKQRPGDHRRMVTVDIAQKKIKRFKTRISRSFFEFSKTGNWGLLRDRIKFLTNNFSVYNPKVGSKKIAGIFHSYPLTSENAEGFIALDNFLKNAVLSKSGRISALSSPKLNNQQKRELLSQSFAHGHKAQSFVHFPGWRIREIQSCWIN